MISCRLHQIPTGSPVWTLTVGLTCLQFSQRTTCATSAAGMVRSVPTTHTSRLSSRDVCKLPICRQIWSIAAERRIYESLTICPSLRQSASQRRVLGLRLFDLRGLLFYHRPQIRDSTIKLLLLRALYFCRLYSVAQCRVVGGKPSDCFRRLANDHAAMNAAVVLVATAQTGKAACLNRECVQCAQDFIGRHAVTSNSISFLRMNGMSRIMLAVMWNTVGAFSHRSSICANNAV